MRPLPEVLSSIRAIPRFTQDQQFRALVMELRAHPAPVLFEHLTQYEGELCRGQDALCGTPVQERLNAWSKIESTVTLVHALRAALKGTSR